MAKTSMPFKKKNHPRSRSVPSDSLSFISYTRNDQSFVRRLDERLRQQNRETWVDWKDIPFTGEWEKEIYSAIERADAFIFVISARAAASAQCLKEIRHAVTHNKRLVPIVRESVAPENLDPSIAAVNWLSFQESDDFETSFHLLITALDMDLEWVHSHTFLLIRAIEWEHSNREGSHTLRGADLQAAEAWLNDANEHPDLKPRPTNLQIEYVAASRRQERYRKRFTLAAVSVALLVTLTLVIVAIQRSRQAEESEKQSKEQGEIAREQGQVALARKLAAYSNELRKEYIEQPDWQRRHSVSISGWSTSALLALEAALRFPSEESERALRQSLNLIPQLAATMPERRRVVSIAFRPDGDCIEIADGIVHIWDPKTGNEVASSPINAATSVAYSPDGKFLAVAGSDSVEVRDSAALGLVAVVRTGPESVPGSGQIVALSPGAKYLAMSFAETATVVDLRTKERVLTIPYSIRLRSLAFSPDGTYLALGGDDFFAHIWDIEAKREISRIKQEEAVWSITFTPDGRSLVTATANDTTRIVQSPEAIKFWQPGTGQLVRVIRGQHDVTAIRFNSTGDLIAATDLYGVARVLEVASGCELVRIGAREKSGSAGGSVRGIEAVSFDPASHFLATADDGRVLLWNIAGRTILLQTPADITSVAASRDGSLIATGTKDNVIRVWNAGTAHLVAQMVQREPSWGASVELTIDTIDFSPDGLTLATGNSDATVRIWETATGKEIARWPIAGGVEKVIFDPQGTILAVIGDGIVELMDPKNLRPIQTLQQPGLRIHDATFRPDGRVAIYGHEHTANVEASPVMYLWDIKNGTKTGFTVKGDGHAAPNILSLTGKHAVGWTSQKLTAWDIEGGRVILDLAEPEIDDIRISPDDQYMAISKNDGVTIRSLLTGEEQGFISEDRPIVEATFAPDAKHLIVGLEDRTLRVLVTFRKAVIDDACQHVSENLTPAEWELYLGKEPYRKTCRERP